MTRIVLIRSPRTPSASPTALRFPSNIGAGDDTSAPYAVLEFANPQNNGLPLWGPSNAGWTYIRRIRTHQQNGFYAQFWYSRADGAFDPATPYVGAHPFPEISNSVHYWEVATDGLSGGDATRNEEDAPITMSHESWLIQALRVTRANANSKEVRLYANLPTNTAATRITVSITRSNYGESGIAETPKLTIGDSPWYAAYQHECASADIAEQKLFAVSLSDADIISEANSLQTLATAAGQAAIWWGKKTYASVNDLTCDYGTGRSFTRVDTGNLISVVSAS